jgi:triacylglycerol esterase/lipase EstA (alpha/beta hydrolase family)
MKNDKTTGKPATIWFIHGANATPLSFSHIQSELRKDTRFDDISFMNVKYDCQDPIGITAESIANSLPGDRPIYLVGHSLGGVLAVAVSQRVKHFSLNKDIKAVITMASPIGGCEGADYLQWLFPHYHLFRNISTKNRLITDIKATGAVVPTLNFVTTSGNNPIYPEANDGVVTVNSQRALTGAKKIEAPYNHFEVLLSDSVVLNIKSVVFDPEDIFGKGFVVETIKNPHD